MTTLIQYASLHPTPWKNGGGCTTEILASPPGATLDDFDFRISLATIAQSGPFSVFPGVDRTLSLVNGGNVVLDVGNERKVALSDREPVVAFPGEVPVSATVDGNPTVDFNVMTRRGRCSHQVERRVFRDYSQLERRSALTVLFLAEGDVWRNQRRMVMHAFSPTAIRAYFDRMVHAVHRFDGTVDKFIGDGMMVLFGAPRKSADPCGDAVRCALAMMEQLDELGVGVVRRARGEAGSLRNSTGKGTVLSSVSPRLPICSSSGCSR